MPTLDQLENALRNADAAGDTNAARALANAIKSGQYDKENTIQQDQSTIAGNIEAPIAGANRIVPQMLGMGADVGSFVNNLLAKANAEYTKEMNAITGTNKTPLITPVNPQTQLGGSAWQQKQIENALGSSPFQIQNPQSETQQNLATAGNVLGYGLTNPARSIPEVIANIAKMTPSAAGAVAGKEIAPNNPYAEGIGMMIGGMTPSAISGTAKLAGKVMAPVLGQTTGAGAEAIKQAYQSGKDASKVFLDNLRNKVPMSDVLDSAKVALGNLKKAAGDTYRSGMVDISKDKTILNFDPISTAMKKEASIGTYKGRVLNPSAQDTVQQLQQKIDEWKMLDPAEYHTPEGLDALKKAIGDIRDSTQMGTPSYKAATSVYNSVKNEINKQAPTYSRVMSNYGESSRLIDQIERDLSQNKKASADTGLRKLQSIMRNNVNTNYGNRLNLIKQLEKQGGAEIRPALAGQALNSNFARGILGPISTAGGAYAVGANPAMWPAIAGAAATMSPRLMGEAAYGAGRLSSILPSAQSIGPGINLSALSNLLASEQMRSKRK